MEKSTKSEDSLGVNGLNLSVVGRELVGGKGEKQEFHTRKPINGEDESL